MIDRQDAIALDRLDRISEAALARLGNLLVGNPMGTRSEIESAFHHATGCRDRFSEALARHLSLTEDEEA